MASGTITPPQPAEPSSLQTGRYETFIEERLHYTRRQVKLVDVATGLMALVAGVLVFLLVAAVIDQWLIEGGLGFWGRFLAMFLLAGGAGWFFWRRIVPPLLHRVNPVFAAQTIEHTRPTLKNSLINFLLVRTHRREVPTVVYQALEQRAATDLTQVKIEAAVDHRHVVHWGYVLTAVVAVFALYMVFSPKNLWVSAARVLLPWASIHAPTRVTIDEVQPGDTTAFYGEFVRVSAQVAGLREGEAVTLIYSTADGQSTDQVIVLTPLGEANRYQCTLPPGSLGLQQDLRYRLHAGDCETDTFRLTVEVAPAILVEKIDYSYPAYTGIPARSTTGQGDLRAVEGTRVTIRAAANHPIKTAEIDLDCDGRQGLRMDVAKSHATGQFVLRMHPDDSGRPQHDSYQLRFTDAEGRTNRRPIRYRIEVIRDLPPEVQFVSPVEEELKVPVDGRVEMRVRAEDADFGLRQVAIRAEQQGRPLAIPQLLNKPSPEKAVLGRFEASFDFLPAQIGLKAGDRITYWAEAEDSKEPEANRAETAKRTLTILAPENAAGEAQPQPRSKQAPGKPPKKGDPAEDRGNPQPKSKPSAQGEQPNDQGAGASPEKNEQGAKPDQGEKNDANDGKEGNQKNSNNSGKGEAAQSPDGSGSSNDQQTENAGQNSDSSQAESGSKQGNQPVNPDTNPGDAFEKILKDQQKQKDQQQADAKKSDGNTAQSDGKQQDASQKPDGKQQDGSQGKPQDQLAANDPKNQPKSKSPAEAKPESGGDASQKQTPDKNSEPEDQKPGKSEEQDSSDGKQAGKSGEKQDGKQAGKQGEKQDGKQGAKPQKGSGDQKGSDKPNESAGQKPDSAEKPGDSGSKKPNKGSRSDTQDKQSSGAGSEKPSGGKAEDKKSPDKGGDGNQAGKKSEQSPDGGEGKQDAGGQEEKPDGGQKGGEKDGGGGKKPDEKNAAGGQKDDGQKGGGGEKPDQKNAAGGQKDGGQKGGGGKEKPDEKQQAGGAESGGSEGAPKPQEKEKQEKSPQSGGQSGGGGAKPGEKKPQEKNEGGGGSQGGEKKEEEKSGGGGDSGSQEKPGGQKPKPGGGQPKPGANDSPRQQAPGKGGEKSESEGSPSPQEAGQSRPASSDNAGQKNGEKQDPAKSPANNSKNSDSKGESAGDRKGGGEEGGGQKGNKKGMGTPGTNTPAEEGGSTANQRGQGETGDKSGEQVKTADNKSSATQEKGPGSGERRENNDKELSGREQPAKGSSPENQNSNDAKSEGGQAGSEMANKPGTRGSGTPTVGGQGNMETDASAPQPDKVAGGDDPNMDYARKQVDLALDHLKDQLAKDKPELLDQLGWSREEARRFLENWRKMQQASAQPGPKTESARKALDEAIKSLGLRPQNTRLKGGRTVQDKLQQLHDGGRFDPPSNWAEQVQEYTKGVATGGR